MSLRIRKGIEWEREERKSRERELKIDVEGGINE